MPLRRVCSICGKDVSEGYWFFAEAQYFCNACFDTRLGSGTVKEPMNEFTARNYVRPLREPVQRLPQ